MVMFLEKPRFDLTSTAVGGETATTGDILDATLESMRLVDNAGARVDAMERAYDDRIDAVRGATGQELPNPERIDMRHRLAKYGSFGPLQEEAPDPRAEFQAQLEQLATEHPEHRTAIAPERPILQDAIGKAKAAETRFEDVWAHSDGGVAAWSARLAGGFYGSLHDPVNVATLAAGPAGKAGAGVKGLLWMGLKQGAANAGTEALSQPFVQQWRKETGLEYGPGQAAINVAGAGLFGFGLDAGVRSFWRGGKHAFGRSDEPPAPATPPGAGPEPSGARLPGLPEGTPPSAPPAPRAYRGADPIPPMEALEQAARNAPEGSILRRAADGDEDALRELAKGLGADADPAIRRALDELEIEKLFPTPLHVDDGAHLESLARAIRHESGAADLPVGDAIVAPVRREVARLADEVQGIATRIEDKPVGFRALDPRQVTTDASTFQFKSGGDTAGVTDRLRGVTRWDPVSAGKAIVFERADGSMVIADGHQRLGLAQRVAREGQDAKLDAYVFREADGWTPEDVRAYAALKNMRESSGTSVDMAQVMRDRPDLIDGSLPLTDAKLRDAAMLARLSPEAFDAVVAGRLPPPFAALIGESVADASRHRGLLDEMAEAGLANTQQARLYLKQLMELPTTVETQMTLFGEESFTRTVLVERAQVLDSALRTLRTDKRIFGLLEDKAAAIEGAGNVLARASNAAKAQRAAELADLIEKLATSRGPVASVLNDAAASVARGLDPKLASRAFVDRIGDILEREGLPGLVRTKEPPAPELAPVRMEDPLGPEAKAQAEDINWALELDDEIKFAIRAFHGTPHDFDRFDLSKIGTGEGAQVFGHGLYFAENEGVAKAYQDALSPFLIDGTPVDGIMQGTFARLKHEGKLDRLAESEAHYRKQREDLTRMAENADRDADAFNPADRIRARVRVSLEDVDARLAEIEQIRNARDIRRSGALYEVDIDAEPHQLLDYDAKLGSQPEMLAKLEIALRDAGSDVSPDILRTQPGSWAYSELEAMLGSADAASQALKDAGIPGLRYLDQGSRFQEHGGSRNIVIFDDSLIKITHKNGKAVSAEERKAAVDAMFSLRGGKADQTQTPEFKRWFGDSKVVDEGGKPLVVYHGTQADIDENFAFRDALIGSANDAGHYGRGFYFASTSGEARNYGPNVESFYLSMKKPLDLTNNTGDMSFPGHFLDWYPKLKKIGMTTPEVDAIWKAHHEMVDYIEKNATVIPAGDAGSPTAGFMASVEHPVLGHQATRPGWQGYTRDAWARTPEAAKAELLNMLTKQQRYYRDQFPMEMDYPSLSDFIRAWHPEGARGITAAAKKAGHDGIIHGDEYIVFDPTQIKSAIGNRGTFDPNDPRIAFATPPRNATLHNTTLSTRAADEMVSIRTEIDKAVAKSLPPGWRAEVRQRLVFGDLSERIQKRNPGVPPSLEIEGTFDPYEKIIYVSMAALDPVERAFEEAGHALKSMRLIPEADYGILQAKAKEIGAREKFRIDERYGDVYGARWKDDPARLEEALEEEAIMQMVAARARGDDFGRQSNVILDKLIKFLRSIRDMLGLKGFRSFEDVFEDMTEGGFARQMETQRGGAGAGRPIGGEVMAGGPRKTGGPVSGKSSGMEDDVAFEDWFRDSKVTDPEGRPLTVYHATKSDVQSFDLGRAGASDPGLVGKAFYFTPSARQASDIAESPLYGKGGTPNIMPVNIALKNPLEIVDGALPDGRRLSTDIHPQGLTPKSAAAFQKEIKRAGYDGVVFRLDGEISQVAAFKPDQIRSIFQAKRSPGDPSEGSLSLSLPESPTAADASFIARAQAASEIMFALGDEGKGKTPETGGEAKPAPQSKAEGQAASAPAKATAVQLPGGRESKRIRNLINQAAAEGKLPREDADALIQRFDVLEQFHKDEGKAKQQIAKELTAEAEHRKRQKDIGELRRRAIVNMLTGFRDARGQADPAKAMQALIENLGQHELPQGFTDVAGHQRAIYGMALADLDGMLHEFRKTLITGQTRNKAKLSDVVRELHGEKTGDELAAGFAQASAKVMEDLRLRFNAAGGNIAKRKDWSMPQSHDKVALLKAGKQTWLEFVQPLLDLKWMKHPLTGDDMSPAEVSKMLGDVWDNLVSDGWHEREASMAFHGLSAIANTRADPRSLIFANADAWMKYSDRFGSGDDALAIIVSHIRGMTKDIAAMEVLGPNPKAMLTYMGQFVEQQAKLRRAGMPAHFPTVTEVTGRAFRAGGGIFARDPVTGYAQSMVARAENMWSVYSGAASAPVNATLAAASQTVKNINVATKLGGATVSALSDPFWQVAARKFAGLPTTRIIRDVVSQIGSAGEREARRAGVIAETYLHLHNEGAREGAALSATKISAYVADRVLSLSMLNAVTRYGNHAMSMGIQGHLADMAGKAFADLDPRLQRMFRRWGLEATDWDAIRLDAGGRARDVDFLSPADIRQQLVDNGGDPSIAERYLAMTLGEAQYATLTGSIRGQAIVYGSLRAGTAQRELWSMFMQFKSFAVNLAILQLERIAREFVSQGFWRGAQYATYALTAATLGGALIEQLQQLRNGKDPRDMTTPEFWGSAAYRSGGLSIWGDLLYASENRFGGGVASTIAGPSASTLNDILNLTYGSAKKAVLFTDNKERTNFGREATNFVKRYTPGASLWYVRAAWERVMMDNLQRMVDPEADASFRRKVQNARKDYKQEFWWKPGGGAIPQRLPSLGAALPAR